MSYEDKVAENKMVAKKCLEMKAYNAGVTRAYYSAFLRIKAYLKRNQFDYNLFIQNFPREREYSHGTLQAAITKCLSENGKTLIDICNVRVLSNLYEKRRRADYESGNIIEDELKASLKDLDTVLSIVA